MARVDDPYGRTREPDDRIQAQFLIPMAVSRAFGVVFSTVVTLLLVPALYVILEDLERALRRYRGRDERKASPTLAASKSPTRAA